MTAERLSCWRGTAVIDRRYRLRCLLRFFLVLERGSHLLDNALKRGFVGDREIGENLAIEADVCGLQALSETAVGEALSADGRVEALNPQITEGAFARFAVAIGPVFGLHG